MTKDKHDELLPCPFCNDGETIIDEKYMPPTMNGKMETISATVMHWCPKKDGQPSGLCISMIGRDRESAIKAWNTRQTTQPEYSGSYEEYCELIPPPKEQP